MFGKGGEGEREGEKDREKNNDFNVPNLFYYQASEVEIIYDRIHADARWLSSSFVVIPYHTIPYHTMLFIGKPCK